MVSNLYECIQKTKTNHCSKKHFTATKKQITATYEKNSLNFGEIIKYFNQNNLKIEDISTDDGDLEDVFVQLTKH